ncbi:MAG: DNA glycosylase AlkZ-like family protein [Mobilitalea sp.]
MTIDDLRKILLYRQYLTCKADKLTVCRNLNGIQAQFMINVLYSLMNRCNEKISAEYFGDGLVKNWTIRGTVHAFAEKDLPIFCHDENILHSHCWEDTYDKDFLWISGARKEYFAKLIISFVEQGITERDKLKEHCFSAGMTETENSFIFDSWGGLLRKLCERGFLCYQVQEKKEFKLCPQFSPMSTEEAELEKVRRYFLNIAPSTLKDASYYFGWTQTKVKAIMNKLPLKHFNIEGKDYFYLGTINNDYPDIPHCILLAGFDQLMLGYQKTESIFLPKDHLRGIFNLAGIVMPPILLDGRVVGRWRKKSNKITFTMFEKVGDHEKGYILEGMETLFDNIKKVEWS